MIIRELIAYLETLAPSSLQESYDNSGLIVGDLDRRVTQAMIALDCTEEVLNDAIAKGCDLVITHHPIVFKGLKSLTGANYVERVIIKAIRHDIALYAIHTNLDNVVGGVNSKLAEVLGLVNTHILSPKRQQLRKLITYVPKDHARAVREALFNAGAGNVGNYEQCSYNSEGYGTFKAGKDADPYVGEVGELHVEPETKIEVIFPVYLQSAVVKGLFDAHPYEEVAYDIYQLENAYQDTGSGMVGTFSEGLKEADFLQLLKEKLGAQVVRHTKLLDKTIRKVAVCGGSGSFLLKDAIRAGADAFVTADFKYHEFFDADGKILIADVGHFESEQFTQELLLEIIQKKFPTFAVRLTGIQTNPINYYS